MEFQCSVRGYVDLIATKADGVSGTVSELREEDWPWNVYESVVALQSCVRLCCDMFAHHHVWAYRSLAPFLFNESSPDG